MRIAIDAMGGDNAPLEIVKGTYLSAVENPAVDILLIGDKNGTLPLVCHVGAALNKKGIRAGDIIKEVARLLGGSGGGRPDFASGGGKDSSKIEEALELVKKLIA